MRSARAFRVAGHPEGVLPGLLCSWAVLSRKARAEPGQRRHLIPPPAPLPGLLCGAIFVGYNNKNYIIIIIEANYNKSKMLVL